MSKKLVPEIRFKEFSGEWEEKKVSDLANRYDNLRIPVTASNRIKGETPYYAANGIKGYVDGYTHDGEFILVAEDGANDLQNYPVQYVNGKIWVNNHAHVLQAKKEISNNIFLMYSFKNINIEPYLVGGGRVKLNANIMMKITLYIPTLQEQQKIADTFSSLDNLIEAHNKKLELLKQHKIGLMQKLFPKDGAKVPEVRLKEFSGEWEEKRLEEVFNYKNGGSFEKYIIENGNYYLITLNSIDIKGELKKEHKTIDKKDVFLSKNDLIMVLSDVAHGNFLGLTALIPEDNKYILNQRMSVLSLKTNDNIQFIRLFINFNQKYFKAHGHGSSQQNLSKGDILKFIIKIPKTPQEQQKIADTFSSLDNLIEAQSKKIEKLKEHKKGLMQKMFVS